MIKDWSKYFDELIGKEVPTTVIVGDKAYEEARLTEHPYEPMILVKTSKHMENYAAILVNDQHVVPYGRIFKYCAELEEK